MDRCAKIYLMAIIPEIKDRITFRNFQSKEVEKEILETIIEAGRLAPSAKNRQPWRFITISEDEPKKKLLEACYNAEVIETANKVIAICTTNINYEMPNGQYSHHLDLSIAASFMMIQAEHEGLGSCLVTTFDEKKVRELLTVPFSMQVFCLLAIGYKGNSQDNNRDRKSFEDIHNYEHW